MCKEFLGQWGKSASTVLVHWNGKRWLTTTVTCPLIMNLYFKDPKQTGKTSLNPHFYWLKRKQSSTLHQSNLFGCTLSSFTLSAVHFSIQVQQQPEQQPHRTALNCLERDKSQLILNSWQTRGRYFTDDTSTLLPLLHINTVKCLKLQELKFGLAVERINKNYLTEPGIVKLCSVFYKKTTFWSSSWIGKC